MISQELVKVGLNIIRQAAAHMTSVTNVRVMSRAGKKLM